ncbi:terminase large subunit [Sphingobium sp. YR768]|uniref:terminase large subunit n=1 Tax=Sphingobium sp. YR768 TaxID=1884365 RepID=UPI0008D30AA1|nr:terminase TerL endonuclease subunit [Sphingobium sp. YR768]SEQ60201.1 Phage terminase-like protein, large subunit, contains N-terminal HTH domain [Sphingobium sp. YR768]
MAPLEWSTSCPDWEERIVRRESMVPPPLFPDEAAAALDVFKGLRIADVIGQPTFGESCEPFVFEFVAAIFGAYDASSGRRLIREFFLLISKKNTKSTLAAGIMVTALVRNWRHYNELLVLAPTKEVADNVFDPAMGMVRLDEDLSTILKIVESERTIKHLVTHAEMKVVAADSGIVSGKKAGFVLVDELWKFGKDPKASNMLLEATGGLLSRPEGFVAFLTTHSDEAPRGVMKEKLDVYRAIRDGTVANPRKLGLLYEFPKKMLEAEEYLDPKNFYVTNPNLGRSVDVETILEKFDEAKLGDPGALQAFLAKHLNVEIGTRLSRDRWTGAEFWDGAIDRTITVDELIRRCEVIVAGVDGGGLDDLLGLCLIGREKGSKRWLVWCHAWAWSIVWKRRQDIVTKLNELIAEGSLTRCEMVDDDLVIDADVDETEAEQGDLTEDVQGVVEILVKVRDAGLFPEAGAIGLDPMGVAAIVDELSSNSFDSATQLVSIPQGYKLSGAVKGSARKLAARTMRHAGTALMQWCVGNAKMEPRGTSAVAIVKSEPGAKIDPLAAMFNAVTLMTRNPEAAGGFIYEERGMLVI